MAKPTFLVTNDDGIQVYFIRSIAAALSEYGDVYIAAPKHEQSWVGRGISRNREVEVKTVEDYPVRQAWEVDGTPSDAINIALGNLMPKKPDVVEGFVVSDKGLSPHSRTPVKMAHMPLALPVGVPTGRNHLPLLRFWIIL